MMPSEPPRSKLSADEIEDAIRALSPASWLRLHKIAAVFSRKSTYEAEDILQEAFCRAVDSRHCPADVDLVKFMAGIMRSVASDSVKAARRRPELHFVMVGEEGELAIDSPDEYPNAEERIVSEQECQRIKGTVIELFSDDLAAQTIAEGVMEGIGGEELRSLTDLDQTGFASKRRLVRRRIEKAFPKGTKP